MRLSSVTPVLWPPMVTVQVLPCVESEPKFCAMPLYPVATIVPPEIVTASSACTPSFAQSSV